MTDAYSSGSAFGSEKVDFQIWDPFAASFITPLSLPDAIGEQLFNGSTPLGTSGTEDVAELKSFLMLAWGLIAIGAFAHMLNARRSVHPNDTNCV
jgi:hypothetical protein